MSRIPDEILKCVAFVGFKDRSGKLHHVGTAFFLARELAIPDRVMVFVVTAKHVIDGIREHTVDNLVYLRMNTLEGGVSYVHCPLERWLSDPDDPFVDVSILAWAPPEDAYHYGYLPEGSFATDDVITHHGIGVGDELFFTGLFVSHYGKKRNIPIVRGGNIAAMPGEPVKVMFHNNTEVGIDAYLAELRSIGGLSGSPVFVRTGGIRGNVISAEGPSSYFLLGLMRGHWHVPDSSNDAGIDDSVHGEAVNMGIGIVVPVSKIIELTDHPDHVRYRRQLAEEYRRDAKGTVGENA